jgi:hypothetical protein
MDEKQKKSIPLLTDACDMKLQATSMVTHLLQSK